MVESLRLYQICKLFRWTHLPNPGGLYDQNPQLLEDFLLIAGIEGEEQERKRKKEERSQRNRTRGSASRGRGRYRR